METWNRDILYAAVVARDKRYDGHFYTGVKTTGVYCRPICPARPLLKNITFFRSQAAAEKAGFRACLRCRPDLSPSSAQWGGTSSTVSRALKLIAAGRGDHLSLPEFSARLGVGERHLRRLFEQHLGTSPTEVIHSHRLHHARQLLSQTMLPITEVALSSGFHSIRRFNDAFRKVYKVPPSSYRKNHSQKSEGIILRIPVMDPFDWQSLMSFFSRHCVQGVESVSDQVYERAFIIDGAQGYFQATYKDNAVQVKVVTDQLQNLRQIRESICQLFDLHFNPHSMALPNDDQATAWLLKNPGIRIPGGFDPLETAVGIILGQGVSIERANHLMADLVKQFGRSIAFPGSPATKAVFPLAQRLQKADLLNLGITRQRQKAIHFLSRGVAKGELHLNGLQPLPELREKLLAIPGIGPWTTNLILMRCLGFSDAVPANDLAIKKAIAKYQLQPEKWSPWGSYVALAIWNHYISQKTRGLPP